MHIKILAESEDLFDRETVQGAVKDLLLNGDTLEIKIGRSSLASYSKKAPEEISVAVARLETDVHHADVVVRVGDHEEDSQNKCSKEVGSENCNRLFDNRIFCKLESTSSVMSNLVANIFGYSVVNLRGITVKDQHKNKIKPEIRIFVPSLPYFGVESEIRLNKRLTTVRCVQKNRYIDDMCQICITGNEILLSLLKEYDLAFAGAKEIYRVVLQKEQVCLVKENFCKLPFLVEAMSQGKTLRETRSLLGASLQKISKVADAVMYPFDEDTDLEFYKEITKIMRDRKREVLDAIYRLVCICPKLRDHRSMYIRKLEGMFLEKTGQRDAFEEDIETDYLKIRRERVIDRIPVLSLKEWYNRRPCGLRIKETRGVKRQG